MKATFMKVAFAATMALTASSASAVIYDFQVPFGSEQAIADGSDLQTILGATQVPTSVLVGGFEFDPVGNGISGLGNVAYADQTSSLPAGIGVCSNIIPGNPIGTNQCNPSSDDNITTGEALGMSFGTSAVVNSFTFRGAEFGSGNNTHSLLASSTFLYSLTGGLGSFVQGMTDAMGVWAAGGLALTTGQIFFATDNAELYVSAADVDGGGNPFVPSVPLPAGGLLLLGGLAGLGFARRRKA